MSDQNEKPINAPVHQLGCTCHLCKDWANRQNIDWEMKAGLISQNEANAKLREKITEDSKRNLRELIDKLKPTEMSSDPRAIYGKLHDMSNILYRFEEDLLARKAKGHTSIDLGYVVDWVERIKAVSE